MYHSTRKPAAVVAAALTFAFVAGSCGTSRHQSTTPVVTRPPSTSPSTPGAPSTSGSGVPGPGSAPSSPAGSGATTTTVLGPSGPPADYPAAQANPPSLACAYPTGDSVNLVTVLKCLSTYSDWVWSHPDPALVANYDLSISPIYAQARNIIVEFQHDGLHAVPTPSTILWVKVQQAPKPFVVQGVPQTYAGHPAFTGGIVTAVTDNQNIPLLNSANQPSGKQYSSPVQGPAAYEITFSQGSDGQYRYSDVVPLNPPGGIAALEQQ